MESIDGLLERAVDYWEAVQYDGVHTKKDERIAIDWLEANCCPVVYDDGRYKVWEDVTDSRNYVILAPQGLRWAKRMNGGGVKGYREMFAWLDEHLKRLAGDAEDFDAAVLDTLGEDETDKTGCASAMMDNGTQWLESWMRLLKEDIAWLEKDTDILFELAIGDKAGRIAKRIGDEKDASDKRREADG